MYLCCVNTGKSKHYDFVCDVCHKRYSLNLTKTKLSRARSRGNYCCRACYAEGRKRGGPADVKMRKTILKVYGVEHHMKLASQRRKLKKTFKKRYGVEHNSQTETYRESCKKTSLERHGCEYHIASSNVIKKSKETCLKRYGVKSFAETGIPGRASGSLVARTKRHMTLKRNGSLRISRIEESFFEALKRCGYDVEMQVYVNGWSIDGCIRDPDCYVQFDGMFWHGLDRPIGEIAVSKRVIDASIMRKWNLDREQNAWFISSSKRLIRVTDREYHESMSDVEVKQLVETKLQLLDEEAQDTSAE